MDSQAFEKLLLAIDRPGDFFTHGRLLIPMPTLEVDGVGLLSFPVPEFQVRALIDRAERAPCAKLRAFCRNPVAKTVDFRLRTDLRRHLHRIIDVHRLDMSHVTRRKGRPYTLVCTKNRASYRHRLTEYGKDVRWMKSLIRSAPRGLWSGSCTAELAQLQEAVVASE